MHSLFNFAYLDAGTGSLIIQSVVGVVAGAAVFGRKVITRISLRVSSLFKSGTKEETAEK